MTKTAQNAPNVIRTRDAAVRAPQYASNELNSQLIHRMIRMSMIQSDEPSRLVSRH